MLPRCLQGTLLLLLWACSTSVVGMRGSRTGLAVSAYDVGILTSFDFTGAGTGSFTYSLTLADPLHTRNSAYAYVFLCTDGDLKSRLLGTFSDPRDICTASTATLQSVCSSLASVGPASPYPANASLLVGQQVSMDLLFAVCPDPSSTDTTPLQLSASWHAVNPGGEELSSGDIPLKQQEMDFAIVWLVAGCLLLGNLLLAHWRASSSSSTERVRAVHWCLLVPPLFFAVEGTVGAVYWRGISASGRDNLRLSVVDTLAWDLASAALVYLIMRLARGWQITRASLSRLEERNLAGLAIFYTLAWAAWQYSYSLLSLFALLMAYALILQHAASSTAWTLRLLHVFRSFSESLGITPQHQQQRQQQQSAGGYSALSAAEGGSGGAAAEAAATAAPSPQAPPSAAEEAEAEAAGSTFHAPAVTVVDGGLSERQVTFLSSFRAVLTLYLTVDMVCEVASDLLFSNTPWVSYLTQELAALLMWCFLAYSIRVRSQAGKSPLFDPSGYLSTEDSSGGALGAALLQQEQGQEQLGGSGSRGLFGNSLQEEEGSSSSSSSAASSRALVTVAANARRAQESGEGGGGAGEDRHIIVDAGGGSGGGNVLAERLPPARGAAVSPPPSSYTF